MRLRSRLFAAFGNWIINRATRTPYVHLKNADGTPYMDRFWLLRIGKDGIDDYGTPRPWIGLRVHHIRSSDEGRNFHDHPWSFLSLILRGGYDEEAPFEGIFPTVRLRHCPDGVIYTRTTFEAGQLLYRRAHQWHRLRLTGDNVTAGTWTLVLTLPKRDERWGFLVDGKKVDHSSYFRARKFGAVAARVFGSIGVRRDCA